MRLPRKTIGPSEEISRRIARPSVVLPEPDSPTTPSVSPFAHAMRDAVDRLHVADRPAKKPRLIGNQTLIGPASTTIGASRSHRVRAALRLRRQQRAACRRCCGLPKTSRDRALLDDLALQHHADPVGHLAHDAEIVGDEQHRHAEPAFSSASSFRICACTVTSSAVVGSSAMRRSGSLASAMAIITRWRWPPESWCG